MTTENILLTDICGRLPYGGITIKLGDYDYIVHGFNPKDSQPVKIHFYKNNDPELVYDLEICVKDYRPYLRPLSSMTEEEQMEYYKTFRIEPYGNGYVYVESVHSFDWLNKHNFDYRGLIPKGLALESSNGMYKN